MEDLNLPVVKGLAVYKTVNLLKDTRCEGVVVSRRLIEHSQVTGKYCLIVPIYNTVMLAEKARIHVKTPYLSGDLEARMKEELQQMEEMGIIRKSSSRYLSPVVVVKKKDAGNRICDDFRHLKKLPSLTHNQFLPLQTASLA